MPGLFQGIEIGKRALMTHQYTLQTIGHNIANVNTPGYSRQRVGFSASLAQNTTIGMIGTGVAVDSITHIRDLFLGSQFRHENKSLGQWTYREKVLSQIESLFGEPNDNTVSAQLQEFWNAWDDLSRNPDAPEYRENLIAVTGELVNIVHGLATQLTRLQGSIDRDMQAQTDLINGLASQIAHLNNQVTREELGGTMANDLRDQRDRLIDDLSSLVDVTTQEDRQGAVTVYIGATYLVDHNYTRPVSTSLVNDNGSMRHEMVWDDNKLPITNLNGQIKGLNDSRDEIIPRHIENLNLLVKTIVEEVNAIHRSGYNMNGQTGIDFFDPNNLDAATFQISATLLVDLNNLSASGTLDGLPGDNTVALAIRELQHGRLMSNGAATFSEYYNSMIGSLGVESREASSFKENYELVVHQIENSIQSVQSVSLDEEMTNMIKFQHAFNAAARVITTMDQALDTVINGMGIVGR